MEQPDVIRFPKRHRICLAVCLQAKKFPILAIQSMLCWALCVFRKGAKTVKLGDLKFWNQHLAISAGFRINCVGKIGYAEGVRAF